MCCSDSSGPKRVKRRRREERSERARGRGRTSVARAALQPSGGHDQPTGQSRRLPDVADAPAAVPSGSGGAQESSARCKPWAKRRARRLVSALYQPLLLIWESAEVAASISAQRVERTTKNVRARELRRGRRGRPFSSFSRSTVGLLSSTMNDRTSQELSSDFWLCSKARSCKQTFITSRCRRAKGDLQSTRAAL